MLIATYHKFTIPLSSPWHPIAYSLLPKDTFTTKTPLQHLYNKDTFTTKTPLQQRHLYNKDTFTTPLQQRHLYNTFTTKTPLQHVTFIIGRLTWLQELVTRIKDAASYTEHPFLFSWNKNCKRGDEEKFPVKIFILQAWLGMMCVKYVTKKRNVSKRKNDNSIDSNITRTRADQHKCLPLRMPKTNTTIISKMCS